jgi:excinuclease ABC subunit A
VFHGNLEKHKKLEGILDILNRTYAETGEERLTEFMAAHPCRDCKGARLRPESLAVTLAGRNIAEIAALPIREALEFFGSLRLNARETTIADRVVREIVDRLEFLSGVGLDYLSLSRPASTLSGGESQRIRLATQIGSRLRGVLYVLDEPSIGLHHKDNERLLETLERLRDLGNTVLVVEHDEDTIRRADYVVDLGPGAGPNGGHIVATGSPGATSRAGSGSPFRGPDAGLRERSFA